jgi:cobalt-zinc-cadmium efflux system membrane fusion protein
MKTELQNTFYKRLKIIKMKSYQNIIYTLIAIFVLGCGDSKTKGETEENNESKLEINEIQVTKKQFEDSGMRLGQITEQSFPKIVETTGMIDVPPQNRAVVSTFSGGYVQKTPLLIGDKVRKDQVLLTLENPEFVEMQQNYLEVAEQLTFLKSEYDRQKTLIEEKISSQKNFLKAESDYKKAFATYNGLKKKLEMLNINIKSVERGIITSVVTLYAPIHGSVTQLNITKGAYVSPADEIMEIINTDHVHLELSVFEKDILQVKEGQKILFKIPEAVEGSFEAEVHLVGTSIDTKNRTVKVHGHLEDDKVHNFAVGMFVNAQIITETTQAKALPNNAIVTTDEGTFVLSAKPNVSDSYSFTQKEVAVGDTFEGYTTIKNTSDFLEKEIFLTKGAFNLVGESSGHEH